MATVLLEAVGVAAAWWDKDALRTPVVTGVVMVALSRCLDNTRGLVKQELERNEEDFFDGGTTTGAFDSGVVDETTLFTAELIEPPCRLKFANICAKTGVRDPLSPLFDLSALLVAGTKAEEEEETEEQEEGEGRGETFTGPALPIIKLEPTGLSPPILMPDNGDPPPTLIPVSPCPVNLRVVLVTFLPPIFMVWVVLSALVLDVPEPILLVEVATADTVLCRGLGEDLVACNDATAAGNVPTSEDFVS